MGSTATLTVRRAASGLQFIIRTVRYLGRTMMLLTVTIVMGPSAVSVLKGRWRADSVAIV